MERRERNIRALAEKVFGVSLPSSKRQKVKEQKFPDQNSPEGGWCIKELDGRRVLSLDLGKKGAFPAADQVRSNWIVFSRG